MEETLGSENDRLREMLLDMTEQKNNLERMYLAKSEAEADKTEQLRRLHDDFEKERQKLLRSTRLDANKELAEVRQLKTAIKDLEKQNSELRRKTDILTSDKIGLQEQMAQMKKADSWSKRTPSKVTGMGQFCRLWGREKD